MTLTLRHGFILAMFASSMVFGQNKKKVEPKPQPTPTQEVKKMTKPLATLKTNLGEIEVELDIEKAPITVENFIKYAEKGHYDGTIFHRVIKGFMIQGGGFDKEMKQKPTEAAIILESPNGLTNLRGTISMARTSVPNSATSQFFINLVDNGFLNSKTKNDGYAVFGKVTKGMEIVDKIGESKTQTLGGMNNVPVQQIIIESVVLKKAL